MTSAVMAFPTPVGMNRLEHISRLKRLSVPHARGDEPQEVTIISEPGLAFPTPVGMNRWCAGATMSAGRVPHARGDEPLMMTGGLREPSRSPRPWG